MSSAQNSLFMMKALEFLIKKEVQKMNEEEKRIGGRREGGGEREREINMWAYHMLFGITYPTHRKPDMYLT